MPALSGSLRKRRGFTLVELLAVIAIIAILAAITISAIGRVREQADMTKCSANLRGLAAAGMLSITDKKGTLPDAMYWYLTDGSEGSLLPYMGYSGGATSTASLDPTPISCPASLRDVGPNDQWNRGYSMNIYACSAEDKDSTKTPYSQNAKKLAQIANPARMAFFMDAYFLANNVPGRKLDHYAAATIWTQKNVAGLYAGHPGGKTNVSFMDGHVEALTAATDFPTGSTAFAIRTSPFWGCLQ
jgi:prepilin-type N-terminal cleavage/methylation domain-containing protein/prepilin-type processing-associated H-X9-DG protein